MKRYDFKPLLTGAVAATAALTGLCVQAVPPGFTWSTVVNNNDPVPEVEPPRNFNSYNQPSVNEDGLVVIRARSRGGPPLGPATHGIYTRDMSMPGSPIVRILDRNSEVPQPNNLGTYFVETPSFPRIDMTSDTIATRGNHQPVWRYVAGVDPDTGADIETRSGTTGIYSNPFGPLVTGAAKLGDVADFSFFEVPEFPGTRFEVFPGAPSATGGNIIAFKGNYTVGDIGKTGVYFRQLEDQPIVLQDGTALEPAAGESPVVLVANNTDTLIPGSSTVFGSTAPPSTANGRIVFAGFDNEENPTLGGIYIAPLQSQPGLTELVRIGERVPGQPAGDVFTYLGEGVAFDGRYVGFWGAWGTVTETGPLGETICASGCRDVVVHCPAEGNAARIAFCLEQCPEPGGCTVQVPVKQGIFVHDTTRDRTTTVAKTGAVFDEFLFWNFSGKVPGVGEGDEGGEDDGEPARWRSSAFVAVSSGPGTTVKAAFKAETANALGIYLGMGPGQAIQTIIDTTMDGQDVDPEAPAGSTITEVGLEREGLRGEWLAVSATMGIEGGSEEDGMAGVYMTRLDKPGGGR